MADSHRCAWTFWPTSLDEAWTCPDCGASWFAWDGRAMCGPECTEPNHIGWSSTPRQAVGHHG